MDRVSQPFWLLNNSGIPNGPRFLCGPGGGSSGTVGFATYVENVHREWLGSTNDVAKAIDPDVVDVMNALFTTETGEQPNPYTEVAAYDVKSYVDEVLEQARRVARSTGYLPDVDHTSRPSIAETEWSDMLFFAQDAVDNPDISKAAESITSLVSSILTVGIASATAAALQAVTDSKTNIDTIVDGAIDKALEVINSQPVKDSIAVFSDSLGEEVNLTKARFSAGMAEANATMSSAFIFGNSNIENAKVKAIERFTTDLVNRLYNQVILSYLSSAINLTVTETQTFNNLFNANLRGQLPFTMQARQVRDARIDSHTQLLSNMLFANISNELVLPQMYNQTFGTSMVAMSERDKEDVRINAEEKMWDLKIYQAGANILGGMNTGGGQLIPEGTSQTASTISGALSGVLAGAAIGGLKGAEGGAMFGPWGAAIGAGIGLALGAYAGFSS